MIVPSADPDTILVPSEENATDMVSQLWASLLLISFRLPARQASTGVSFGQGRAISGLAGEPESQTLIVLSSDPDTILVPSGENATDLM